MYMMLIISTKNLLSELGIVYNAQLFLLHNSGLSVYGRGITPVGPILGSASIAEKKCAFAAV